MPKVESTALTKAAARPIALYQREWLIQHGWCIDRGFLHEWYYQRLDHWRQIDVNPEVAHAADLTSRIPAKKRVKTLPHVGRSEAEIDSGGGLFLHFCPQKIVVNCLYERQS